MDVRKPKGDPSLVAEYLVELFNLFSKGESENLILGEQKTKKHFTNFKALIRLVNWNEKTKRSEDLFFKIKPWKYSSNNLGPLNTVREILLPYMGLYLKNKKILWVRVKITLHFCVSP